MLDTGDNPDAPAPREMIDLEVMFYDSVNDLNINVICSLNTGLGVP